MPTNRLLQQKSPYLRQHAHNPVDWFPWGEEAFSKSRGEAKPIFLSIGYSTCHWCHVMERESFENDDVAALLNAHFVPVKVDREERPDVDRIYMAFVQAATGGGGWPMSVFLTPELKPFFGGTYFPPDNRYGRSGFKALLEYLARAWRDERPKVEQSAAGALDHLRQLADPVPAAAPILDRRLLESGFNAFRRAFDSTHGGFGGAPKFPRPSVFHFLLRHHHRTGNAEALAMTLETLRAMAAGGIHDRLGGGFHRYSVDERWFVPHFEKMLYDQAQLASSYLEAFQITRDPFFEGVARAIFDYVLRDLAAPDGGFYSAEDADSAADPSKPSDMSEGAFYLWSRREIESLLGQPAAETFSSHFGVLPDGNVRDDPHGEFGGLNILYSAGPPNASPALADSIATLLAARAARPRPLLDDKILAAWNGLMISAFAQGARILGDPRYLHAAERAAAFLFSRMYDAPSNTLLRRFRDGDAAIPGFLDDYAFVSRALLDLYEATFDAAHLERAETLADRMLQLFEDRQRGALFSTADGDSRLLLRMKDDYDGAEPSGNAVAAEALLVLAQLTGRAHFRASAERALDALASRIAAQPSAAPRLLAAAGSLLSPPTQVVFALPENGSLDEMLRVLRERFLPDTVALLAGPRLAHMKPLAGLPTAYVCQNFACRLPTSDPAQFRELLQ